MARGAWSATGHAITESDLTEHTHAHTHTHTHTHKAVTLELERRAQPKMTGFLKGRKRGYIQAQREGDAERHRKKGPCEAGGGTGVIHLKARSVELPESRRRERGGFPPGSGGRRASPSPRAQASSLQGQGKINFLSF